MLLVHAQSVEEDLPPGCGRNRERSGQIGISRRGPRWHLPSRGDLCLYRARPVPIRRPIDDIADERVLALERYHLHGSQTSPVVVHELLAYRRSTRGRSDVSHRHGDFDQIIYFAERGQHHVDFRTIQHQPRTLCLIPVGGIHRFDQEISGGIAVNIDAGVWPIDANIGRARALAMSRSPLGLLPSRWNEPILGLFEQIAVESKGRNPLALTGLLTTLLALTIEALSGQENAVPRLVLRYLDLVEATFRDPRPMADYARQLGASLRTLHAATSSSLGRPPSQLLQERRILEAKRLLAHSEQSVAEIASHLGFADASYFSRFFKKMAGVAPLRFRTMKHPSG